jgi:NAD(P)-dependent dehydrogenase (short-subunit alcohol dehydrogenase family)
MARHTGKVALVTGAGQGIGRAVTSRLLAEGASVVALDVNRSTVERVASELGPLCHAVVADVSDAAACEGAVAETVGRFGSIDILVAHAGIAEPRPFLDIDPAHWRRHMAINLDGALYCAVPAARAMVAAGHGGSIVFTASVNGFDVEETMAAYNVTKGALLTLVRSAAIDLGKYGIRANGVAPGVVDTPIAALVVHNPEIAPGYLRTIPLGRFGEPDDIASVVSWLASSEAAYVTGQTLVVDGGQTLGIMGDLESSASALAHEASGGAGQ